MAQTSKSGSGKGGTRSSSTKKTASKSASTRTRKKPVSAAAAPEDSGRKRIQRPHYRGLKAFVFLMLAVFSLIGCFTSEGWFISFFREFMQGLIGKGFFFVPLALAFSALMLVMFKDRPVKSRIICTLLLTIVVGALIHLFTCSTVFEWSWRLPGELYRTGITAGKAGSGGIIGGLLALGFKSLFNMIGATIVLGLSFIFLLLAAFDITFVTVAEWYKNRPIYEPAPYDDEFSFGRASDKTLSKAPVGEADMPEHPVTFKPRKPIIDIPVDDPPRLKKESQSYFDTNPGVEPPDKKKLADILLKDRTPVQTVQAPPVHTPPPQPVHAPAPMPVSEHKEAAPTAAMTPEQVAEFEAKQKIAKAAELVERQKAAVEVAQSIEKNLTAAETLKYTYPPLELLAPGSAVNMTDGREEMAINAKRLSATIKSFGISAEICNITRGPSVTRYELEMEQGVKLNKLTNLADDIALALGATGVRIAPIPDKISIVGIEVPNKLTNVVGLRDILGTDEFKNKPSKLTFAIGKDIGNVPIIGDISKLPHLLIAGTTGSGKSVCMNSLILSLLYKASPEEVRLIMVDPKMIELGIYNGIPHLLIPVVTDPKKAAGALQWAVMEMLKRNRLLSEVGARDLESYNKIMKNTEGGQQLPQIVVLIDELADLMIVAAKDVEESICRVAQMGRAAGIHLIIATQRPSADVITGLMKANIPSRIAFAVDSALNSRIILDTMGAEKLVGKGDMLYKPVGLGKPVRVQGTFMTDAERENIINFVKEQGLAKYSDEVIDEIERTADKDAKGNGSAASVSDKNGQKDEEEDELFGAAVDVVLESGQASVSMLQRRLKLGYSRAARVVDQMEERGIVGPFEGSKPRALLITREKWNEMQGIVSPEPVLEADDGDEE